MLAASTPLLALSLVYGGPVVANSLAGRFMGGAKLAPEKTLAPDAMNVAPAMTLSTRTQTSSVTGASTSPGVGEFTYSMAKTANQAVSSTASALQSATAQVSSTQSKMLSGSTSTGNRITDGDSFTSSMMHSQAKQDVFAAQAGQNIARGVTGSSSEKQAIEHAATGLMGVSVGGRVVVGAEVAFQEQLRAAGGTDEGRINSLAHQATEAYTDTVQNSDEYRDMKNYAASHSSESVLSSDKTQQKADQWASALNNQVTATEQYNKVASIASSGGLSREVKASELGYTLYKHDNGETNNRVRELMQSSPEMYKEMDGAMKKATDTIRASGVGMPGDHLDLATKFLALNSVRPEMALEIARNAFTPSEHAVDTGLKPDTFKTDLKPSDIMRPGDARAVQQSAGGGGDITRLFGNEPGSAGSMHGGSAPAVNASHQNAPDAGGSSGREAPASNAHRAPVSGTDSTHAGSFAQTHASGADGDSSNAERRGSSHGKPDIWERMDRIASNGGIPIDRAAAAGNASGHTNHAPSSWGDIIKNNVGRMPAAPAHPSVPRADAVKKDIDNKNLGHDAMDHYDEKGGLGGTNTKNLEGAMWTEGGVLKDGLKDLAHNIPNGIKDLGGAVREKVFPSNDKK
jgi:hypothetical protein